MIEGKLEKINTNHPASQNNAAAGGGPNPPGAGTPAASAPDTSQLIADCQEDDGKAAGSSLSATAFNYVNSIIGSGVIGMPYALKESGVLLGLFTLCMVAALTDYSLILLVKNGNLSKTSTYQVGCKVFYRDSQDKKNLIFNRKWREWHSASLATSP